MRLFITIIMLFGLCPALETQVCASEKTPLTGLDVANNIHDVDSSIDSVSKGTMTITRGGQTLTRKLVTYSKKFGEDERSLITFEKPVDVKGVKYLIWSYQGLEKDEDIWVFMPTANRVRRICGSAKYAPFMRSDFATEDIHEYDDVAEYTYKILGSEVLDGVDCCILERTPKPERDTQYSKKLEWVRKDNWLRKKIEFYDKKGNHLKTLVTDREELIDGIWTVTKLTLSTPSKNSRTVMDWNEMIYDSGLKDDMFEQSRLQR